MLEKIKSKRINIIFFGVVFALKGIYFHLMKIKFYPDSYEYISRDGFSWIFGNLDRYRLPLYPMLLDLFEAVFGEHYTIAICCFQLAVTLLSLVVLYKTLKCLLSNDNLVRLLTFLYAFSTAILGWEKIILTESLSLSLTVFMVYGLVKYLKTNKVKYAASAVIIAGIGTLLRAVFALYTGVIFGFFILRLIFPGHKLTKDKKSVQRKSDIKCALISVFPIALILIYAAMFNSQYGAFTLSDSGLGQQLSIVLKSDYYLDTSDEELKQVAMDILNGYTEKDKKIAVDNVSNFIKQNYTIDNQKQEMMEKIIGESFENKTLLDSKYENNINEIFESLYQSNVSVESSLKYTRARFYLMSNYDRNRIVQFVNEAKSNNKKSFTVAAILNLLCDFEEYYSYKNSNYLNGLLASILPHFFPCLDFSLLFCCIVGCMELLITFVCIIKKKYYFYHLGFATMILLTIFLSIFGTNYEFPRTAITMYPMIFAVFSLWLERFVVSVKKEISEQNSNV